MMLYFTNSSCFVLSAKELQVTDLWLFSRQRERIRTSRVRNRAALCEAKNLVLSAKEKKFGRVEPVIVRR